MELKNGDFCWVWFAETNEIMWGVVVDNRICYQNGSFTYTKFYNEHGKMFLDDMLVCVIGGIVRNANSFLDAKYCYANYIDDSVNIVTNNIDDKYDEICSKPLKISISDLEFTIGREIYITT